MKHVLRIGLLAVMLLTLVTMARPLSSLAGGEERVMVEFSPGRGPMVRAVLERAGGQVHYQFDRLNTIAVSLPSAAVDGIRRNPNVVLVEEDARRYMMAEGVPWGVDAVQARDVWDVDRDGEVDAGAPTGSGVTVCIIDSGLQVTHEEFADVAILGGYPEGWHYDRFGHGTHVAGTIAAAMNEVGVVGVTPGAVSLYIVKVFGDDGLWAYSSTLIDASERCADAGANIISMSLGGPKGSRSEQRQFDALYAQGLLSVAAAGNDGNTAYNYPASYDSVISVAAIDEDYVVAEFSQQNDQVELAAPGVDVLSTVGYVAVDALTVDDVTYVGAHIEYAPTGTPENPLVADGLLVDGGLCASTGTWTGAVVLCARGDISFYDKVMNVQAGGGVAAVIYNNDPGNFLGTLEEGHASEIVAISLSQEDGQYLVGNKLGLDLNGTVVSYFSYPDSGYEAWGGTSMATPHVSAVAALLWSSDETLTNEQIRDAMVDSAMDLGVEGPDVAYGYGLVQAKDALDLLSGSGGSDDIVLWADTRMRGQKAYVDLTWTGASGATVVVYRNGGVVAETANDGAYSDYLGRNVTGPFTYQICAGDGVCSNVVTVDF